MSISAVLSFFGDVGKEDEGFDFLRMLVFVGGASAFTSVVLHLDVEVFTKDTAASGGADIDFFNNEAFVDADVQGLVMGLLRESDNT